MKRSLRMLGIGAAAAVLASGSSLAYAIPAGVITTPDWYLAAQETCFNAWTAWQDGDTDVTIGGRKVVWGTGGSGNQIVLGDSDMTLSGGAGDDILCAEGGNNTLLGGGGNDVLMVGAGSGFIIIIIDPTVENTPNKDVCLVPDGPNSLFGGSGNDLLGAVEDDYVDGGTGKNKLYELPLSVVCPPK